MSQSRAGDAVDAHLSTLPDPGGPGGKAAFRPLAEVTPVRWWEPTLRNNRDNVPEHAVHRHTTAVGCRMGFPAGCAR